MITSPIREISFDAGDAGDAGWPKSTHPLAAASSNERVEHLSAGELLDGHFARNRGERMIAPFLIISSALKRRGEWRCELL